MPCPAYTDPRLAACYDSANPHDPADDFYLALAGAAPKTILDMGCGTGRLAVALAERGHRVTGADPSAGMMRVARNRAGGERVTWVDSDSASLALETRFDLIIMTGHVFQVFLEDDEVRATLRNLRRHLAPGWPPRLRDPQSAGRGMARLDVHRARPCRCPASARSRCITTSHRPTRRS